MSEQLTGRNKAQKTLLQFAEYIRRMKHAGRRDLFMVAMPADAAQEIAGAIEALTAEASAYTPPPAPEYTPPQGCRYMDREGNES